MTERKAGATATAETDSPKGNDRKKSKGKNKRNSDRKGLEADSLQE